MEKGGQIITASLKKKVRFGQGEGCQFLLKCNVCRDKDCHEGRAVYQVTYKPCQEAPVPLKAVYIGMTSFTLHKRFL